MTDVNEKMLIQEEQEPLDILLKTMEKYVKNKRNCSPEDLSGKYAKSFQALKKAQTILDEMEIGKRAGKAVFADMNIDALIDLAQSARNRVVTEAWWPYQMEMAA